MSDNAEGRLMLRAATRHGVFTLQEWTEAGLSRSTLQRRVGNGVVRRLFPGVYATAAAPDTYERNVVAAVSACPDLAAASHVTAAFLWNMIHFGGRTPYDIELVTRRWRRVHRSVTVHESTDLIEADVTMHRGVPVTTPTRTIVDLGASAKSLVGPAVDHAIRHGMTDVRSLLDILQRVARRGRSGVGVLRPHLAERLTLSKETESYLETLFARGLSRRALPRPQAQVPVFRPDGTFICRLDFAYPDTKLGIALDGFEYHSDQTRFRIDRAQQNDLELLGWMVLRYTWWDVSGGMDRTASQVREALRRRSQTETA